MFVRPRFQLQRRRSRQNGVQSSNLFVWYANRACSRCDPLNFQTLRWLFLLHQLLAGLQLQRHCLFLSAEMLFNSSTADFVCIEHGHSVSPAKKLTKHWFSTFWSMITSCCPSVGSRLRKISSRPQFSKPQGRLLKSLSLTGPTDPLLAAPCLVGIRFYCARGMIP